MCPRTSSQSHRITIVAGDDIGIVHFLRLVDGVTSRPPSLASYATTHSGGALARRVNPGVQVALVGKVPNQSRHFDGGLFYGLATEKDFKIPTQPERRERDLIKNRQKPIALFIDDAHGLRSKTLIGLKRLIEVVRDSDGMLSVVLAGHPKLKNDLRWPNALVKKTSFL